MADSDDEYDRKRRDKFRGERESYRTERRDERRPIGGAGGGRDEWAERNPFRGGGAGGGGVQRHRPDYSDYRGPGPRPRYGSPGREMPPAKRMRPDWGEGDGRPGPRYGGYDPYLMQAWTDHYQSMHSAYHHASHPPPVRELPILGGDTLTQPAMLTLKQFLDTQDENISDSEVMRKYTEYKTDFKRQQLNEFFVAHKDEEWFKNKYHPEDSVNRSEEQRGFLRRRTDVFVELLENGTIGSVKVDSSHSDALIKVLDTCVIKLEGGTDEDLKVLDEKPVVKDPVVFERKPEPDDTATVVENTPKSPKKEKEEDEEMPQIVSPQRTELKPVNSDDENWDDPEVEAAPVPAKKPEEEEPKESEPIPDIKQTQKKQKKKKIKKRKRNSSSDEESSSSESESSSSSSEEEEDDEKLKAKYDVEDGLRAEQKAEAEKDQAEAAKAKQGPVSPKEEAAAEKPAADPPAAEGEAKEDGQAEKSPKPEEDEKKQENGDAAKTDESAAEPGETGEDADTGEVKPVTIDLDKVNTPRAMHRTSSIFLRNLAPSITKAEIEALCSRFSGYLRTAIADPLVERRWYRRGWITFTRDVNIKEICWSLNNQRLRDCEMGAIVNRDLSRRVRPANGITSHKQVVRSDIKLCARIVMNLDEKFKLWSDNQLSKPSPASDPEAAVAGNGSGPSYGFNSKNPVLQNITDYLIEEASAEEEELLGLSGDRKDGEGEPIERDEQLLSVLDRLVLYLRVVHSVDYYNHCEYPYEDEMPNRCGIIHARGPAPSRVTSNELNEYIKSYEGKLLQFLTKTALLSEDQIKDLGAKNADTEVEKFVQANTQELAKDKWLCPLSGKKFKGPEFIRKHIFNKHEEKVDEVRKEVQYFNNYLRDPKRPQLPEHPGSVKRPEQESARGPGGYRPPMYTPMAGMPYGFGGHMMGGGGRGGRHFAPARRPGGFDYRSHRSHYRDLDAPQDPY
ncbi:serrate RNA effector molecule homolog [Drosophila madeirensis]|uniref:Serrate RNA effector molecule homolog n=1 Tax=Drosophila madeirensis TaxID=30013 RepID=A0AAU9GDE9_DROMD